MQPGDRLLRGQPPFLILHLDLRGEGNKLFLLVGGAVLFQGNGEQALGAGLDKESLFLGRVIDMGEQPCLLVLDLMERGVTLKHWGNFGLEYVKTFP